MLDSSSYDYVYVLVRQAFRMTLRRRHAQMIDPENVMKKATKEGSLKKKRRLLRSVIEKIIAVETLEWIARISNVIGHQPEWMKGQKLLIWSSE